MSKEQIVNYVMNTPGNTNRIILEQMIDAESKNTLEIAKEMDAETLEMAKAYSDSKGGYIEPGVVLLFGNVPTMDIVVGDADGRTYAKISDSLIDLKKVGHIFMNEDGVEVEIPLEAVQIETFDTAQTMLVGGASVVSVYNQDSGLFTKGTWALYINADNCVSRIEIPETIHPIDPKFLPPMGGGLEVVELTTEPSDGGTPLTKEESARLEKTSTQCMPIVVRLTWQDTTVASVADCVYANGEIMGYSFLSDGIPILIAKSNGMWAIRQLG